jgi:hypothetical protein
MSEAFAASVRALELSDDAAMLKAMGHGDLLARVREYERAEAVAPVSVQADIRLTDAARQRYLNDADTAREAGHEDRVREAEALTRIMEVDRERLQVADAARVEWEEATADQAAAASEARAELTKRGTAREDEARPEAQAAQRDEQLAHNQAERDRAAIDEPVSYAQVQADLEAIAAADKAEADYDVDLEI